MLGSEKNRTQALPTHHTRDPALHTCLCLLPLGALETCSLREQACLTPFHISAPTTDANCSTDMYYMKEINETHSFRFVQNVQMKSRENTKSVI